MNDVKASGVGQVDSRIVPISSTQKSHDNVTAIDKQDVGAVAKAEKVVEKTEQAVQPSEKGDVKKAVTQLNDYVQSVQRNLQFNLDDASGKTIITVVDRDTSKVIRQIPDDVALKLAEELQQSEPLSLFNAKV